MTSLLVSVRDRDEALAAYRGGADLIDIKEPSSGSLGAASPAVLREILDVVPTPMPLSVALGELIDKEFSGRLAALAAFGRFQYAKVGLAQCLSLAGWQSRWTEFRRGLPATTWPVAVAYADWKIARSPDPFAVLQFAIDERCRAILVDTFDKSSGTLLDYLSPDELTRFNQIARDNRLTSVIGGSLNRETIPLINISKPAYIAVRGAVCLDSREDSLSENLVRDLAQLVHARASGLARH